MIRTTNAHDAILLIAPFSIDAVEYVSNGKCVRVYVQGTQFTMNAKVFEADVLPTIEEEAKYGKLND